MLSIITPVYNGERFIESCINVVIDQHCSNVEHIIIDGGSSDGTVKIIEEYAHQYPHIRWISEKDKGQSDAMNKGIAMAKGEIIGFLNVDDFYESNVFNRVVGIFEDLPEPSLLVGNCKIWDDEGEIVKFSKPAKLKLYDLITRHEAPCNPSAYFYHTSLHQKVGDYKIDEHYAMDLDFILKAVQVAIVKYVDEHWGNQRLIKGTKTLNDLESGQWEQRAVNMLNSYRKDLSLFDRGKLVFKEKLANIEYRISSKLTRVRKWN